MAPTQTIQLPILDARYRGERDCPTAACDVNMDSFKQDRPVMTCQAVYLLTGQGVCYSCHLPTRLFALMALPPFQFVDEDEEPLDDDGFMLKNIGQMPAALAAQLGPQVGRLLRPDFSRTVRASYWMNHCERCDAKQGDHYVQGPNGPFWPYTPEEMDTIAALRLEGPHPFMDVGCAAGAMSGWRDRKHGIAPVEIPQRKRRKASPDRS